jgi:hypothetical protein
MHFGKYHLLIPTLIMVILGNTNAVPPVLNYAGQVAVNGEAFDGAGLFKFALVNADGRTTYWSNDGTGVDGSEPQVSVSVAVNGGLYAVLLGNTAQQGMGPIDPSIFAQHTDAKLRIWFSDGVNGFQQLSPDRPFASVPYAFSAGTAQTASSATIADGSINRSMLSEDIISDLNRTISHNDLSPQIKADINATIGLHRLSAEVILKLEQNATITNGSVTGSKMADGAVTAIKMADGAITTDKLNEQILKYLKPEITSQPQAQNVYADTNATFSVIAEGKYLTYQWKKDGADLTGETNATLTITDANSTQHDGNYSIVVSNDFGSVESGEAEVIVDNVGPLNGLVAWWKFDETSGTVAYDSSGNENHGDLSNGPTWVEGNFNGALSFDGIDDIVRTNVSGMYNHDFTWSTWVKTTDTEAGVMGVSAEEWLAGGSSFYIQNRKSKIDVHGVGYRLGSVILNSNQWIHYLLTVKDSGGSNDPIKIFVDGQIDVNSQINWFRYNGQNFNLRIGHVPIHGDYYKGLIDDVRIYDRVLSAEEVQALYNLGQ